MSTNKTGETKIRWSTQRVLEKGLSQTHVSMLDELISGVDSHCSSVVLCGSWAEESSSSQSDLDLLFISKDESDKKATMTVLESLLTVASDSIYDCKVLSRDDIRRLSKGPQHFSLWLMLSKGVILSGYDLKETVSLDYERVRSIINDLSEKINDCITSLESNMHYTGTCVQLAYTARTIYFIEKHLLKRRHQPIPKSEFIKQILGPLFIKIEQLYHEVALTRKSLGELDVRSRIQARRDSEYSKKQYQELHAVCVKLEKTVLDLRLQLESTLTLP